MTDTTKTRLTGLEAMRGLAAILVVLHHAGIMISDKRFYGVTILDFRLGNFNVGIDFFFVLSGFIISWIHWGELGQPEKLLPYLQKRFLRIYPVYWLILIPLIVSYFAFPDQAKPIQRDPLTIFCSFFLLPNSAPPVMNVAWTLVHEVLFYAVFGLLIGFGRKMIALLWAWGAMIVLLHLLQFKAYLPLGLFISAFNMEFLIGVALAVWLKSNALPRPRTVLALGAVTFVYFMLFQLHIQENAAIGRLVFGTSSALIIAGLVELERSYGWRFSSRWLLLGAASYVVYLTHPILLSACLSLIFRFGIAHYLPPEAALIVLLAISIMGGAGFHLYVEKPLRQAIDRLSRRFIPSIPKQR